MKVSELHEQTQGETTADYEVVIEQPGTMISVTPLWTVHRVYRDTANKRVVILADEIVNEQP